nr:MAG TPA: hypothetical protein [Caudoviricetes sp.]
MAAVLTRIPYGARVHPGAAASSRWPLFFFKDESWENRF